MPGGTQAIPEKDGYRNGKADKRRDLCGWSAVFSGISPQLGITES